MPEPLDLVRRRLHTQRLTGTPFERPVEVVRFLGAMQAQEYAEAKWSIAERTRNHTDAELDEVFDRGELVRTHVLRPTWHFVAPDDLRWLLRLSGPRVDAGNGSMYRQLELDAAVLARAHDVVAAALAGDGPLTRKELATRLGSAGIEAAGMRLGYVMMSAELAGLVCSGPRRGKQHTYALLDERVPASPRDGMPREEAVAELVLRYFRGHGPATVRDFSTWSGLTGADAHAGLDAVRDHLETFADEDSRTWYAAPPEGASAPAESRGLLVPMYDETVVAYHGTRVVLATEPPRPGLLERPIVVDGRTVGSWRRTVARRTVTVEALLFADLDADARAALDAVVERFGRFLGLAARLLATAA